MKVNILGAGPAGLYAAILIKQKKLNAEVCVFEQNAPNATFGFGVVFSDKALAFLHKDDAETAALIEPHMQRWSDITINHKNEEIKIDGIGFAGIQRLKLLQLLYTRARLLGVEIKYRCRIDHIKELPAADMVIGADGINSLVRKSDPDEYGEKIRYLKNRFVWYGCEKEFDTLTQTFIDTPDGPMNAHHYAYAPGQSTFIVETGEQTYASSGFSEMPETESRKLCEDRFYNQLLGAKLTPNHSTWRRFPILSCQQWFKGHHVLIGDALHTAHFSIGSGTRLALEDVVSLVNTLQHHDWDISTSLALFQARRQPVLKKLIEAAALSASWYDRFGEEMQLPAWQFALSYIRRAGRIDAKRLKEISPAFCQNLRLHGVDLETGL